MASRNSIHLQLLARHRDAHVQQVLKICVLLLCLLSVWAECSFQQHPRGPNMSVAAFLLTDCVSGNCEHSNGKCKNCCTLVNPVCTLLQHNWKRMSPAYKCRTPKISLHTKVSGDAVLPWQHSPRRVILVRPFHSLSITICLWSNWVQHPVGLLKPCSVAYCDPTPAQVDVAISSLSTTLPMSYTLQHSWVCLIT